MEEHAASIPSASGTSKPWPEEEADDEEDLAGEQMGPQRQSPNLREAKLNPRTPNDDIEHFLTTLKRFAKVETPRELYTGLKELFAKWVKPEQSTVTEITALKTQLTQQEREKLERAEIMEARVKAKVEFKDVVIFDESWEDLLAHIQKVLQLIKSAGLTVNPKKCAFAHKGIQCLGFVIGEGFIRPQVGKVEVFSCPYDQEQGAIHSTPGGQRGVGVKGRPRVKPGPPAGYAAVQSLVTETRTAHKTTPLGFCSFSPKQVAIN
ncbi:hypothetical protein AAFF_G00068990 [Aldrovandia affinis]|uniref:Uncharacterized protein n=1 Tax=Aldrovandia affinis TaxID=143900 RepID=A0AAD7RZ63_9TELE|nr:hypothetical protein AAFF_G00068990 [Aldrovandia affinis]